MSTTNDNAAVANVDPFDDATLRDIDFDAAVKLAAETFGGVEEAADSIGNGFEVLDKDAKDALIGLPCMFLAWEFHLGDYGEFVSVTVVAKERGGGSRKVILNDGSTGIYKQLLDYTRSKSGRQGGLFVRKGLTRSDYEYTDEKTGKTRPASTYYIDTSA